MTSGNPVLRKRQLGEILKRAREDAKVTREEAAAWLETTVVYIGRVERGASARVKLRDLRTLMKRYGMPPERRAECEQLLSDARQEGWWFPYTSALRPSFSVLLGLEAGSSMIETFETTILPGLLQTEDYARAVMRAAIPRPSDELIENRVKVRVERQGRLLSPDGPRLHAVIDESALRRKIGGDAVWRGALTQLAEIVSGARNVTVQVLPLDVAVLPTVLGSFMLMHLRDGGSWVACLELKTGDRFEEGDGAHVYRDIFSRLVAEAERPDLTTSFISTILKD